MAELSPEEGFAEAERRIAAAKANGSTRLLLGSLNLVKVPKSLTGLTELKWLQLEQNALTALPEFLGQLVNLERLYVHDNEINSLSDVVLPLVRLQTLALTRNRLLELPAIVTSLVSLHELYLGGNQLTFVPESIGELKRLRVLFLWGNRLSSLPESIGRLTKLVHLELHGNQLVSLPVSLRGLKSLRSLDVRDNPALKLPATVLGDPRGSSAAKPILDYYFRTRLAQQGRPLREGKIILVGRGEVGKTSLVRRLVDNKFSRREDRTQGIRITQWPLEIKRTEKVRMHIWDFGGQEIMHATHQFFLTDRSVYLLVLDGRAGQQEVEADYWLRLISSFAPESPVLVVLNKIKKDPFDLNRRALQEKFPQIRGFVETDCDNANSKHQSGAKGFGIDTLRKAIAWETSNLPDLRAPFPAAWFEIKEALAKKRKNYLSFAEYRKLCGELGEPDTGAQESLATHLHRLGIALNYRDDRRLRDTHVLNPHWVTEGIYALLNSPRLAAAKGELRLSDLRAELDGKRYPREMHQFLLDLMEKFEVCFSFPRGDRYLIPELLDEQQPKEADKFDPAVSLNFQYHYPVIPRGLVPRFIVRTHVLSDKYRWRTGVILSFEGNTALIKADLQDRRIFISIQGPSRRRMLAVIREEFDSIHRDIQHLNPSEMVPLPDHPGTVVPYRDLEVIEKSDPDAIWRQVIGDEIIEVPVRNLLNGVDLGPRPGRSAELPVMGSGEPLSVFYSYAHADAKLRLRLDKHLAPLRRLGLIVDWCDHDIIAGDEWAEEIAGKLKEADIVLLLISADFVNSDFCYEKELAEAMKKHEEGEAAVVPVIVRSTNAWTKLPFGKLQALPAGGKPIPRWPTQDDGWADVARGVEQAAETLLQRRGVRPARLI